MTADGSRRRIGPTAWGRWYGWVAGAATLLGPLAVLERGFGLHQTLTNQILVLPIGLAGGIALLRAVKPRLLGPAVVLRIAADRLEVTGPGASVAGVDRPAVGAVIVDGDDMNGRFSVVVLDNRSRELYRWSAWWPGRRPASVVRALTRAGWPAAIGAELYDGRFRAQVPGQPPVLKHPSPGNS